MAFGPLEYGEYLRRKQARRAESAESQASATLPHVADNRLTVISGLLGPARAAHEPRRDAIAVYEAIVDREAGKTPGTVRVRVLPTLDPIVLVLSSPHIVSWLIELDPGAELQAVLLAGSPEALITGALTVPVISIGAFHAFQPDTPEYRHLEHEVLRFTGRTISHFQSTHATDSDALEVGG